MVSDFGLGRCFGSKSSQEPRQRKKCWLFKRKSVSRPLLDARQDLSLDGIGTVRWSAPELSRREKYDGSIDVYRCKKLKLKTIDTGP
jgi:hypothetical protein